jgi:hypothetical protein
MTSALTTYEPRDPSRTVFYKVIADHLETFLASLDADPDANGVFTGPDRDSPYNYPHNERSVLRQPSSHTR